MNKITAPWAMSGEDVLRESGGSHGGLNDEAVRQRLAHFGANTLAAKDQEPWYLLFLEQFANPLVYMLIGAAAIKGYLKGLGRCAGYCRGIADHGQLSALPRR